MVVVRLLRFGHFVSGQICLILESGVEEQRLVLEVCRFLSLRDMNLIVLVDWAVAAQLSAQLELRLHFLD